MAPRAARALAALAAAAGHAPAAAASTPVVRAVAAPQYDFRAAEQVLLDAIAARTFPGAAVAVTNSSGAVVLLAGYGSLSYGDYLPHGPNAPVTPDTTRWDMASMSKILGGTTVSAILHERGILPPLDTPIADPALLGPAFAANGKGGVTIRLLLEHAAGFPPDPVPGYWEASFGCGPRVPTPPEDFGCVDAIFAAVLNQSLAAPPGSVYVYSDLSLITLAFALGALIERAALVPRAALRADCAGAAARSGLAASCHFEAFVRTAVLAPLGMAASGYLLEPALAALAAPTWFDDAYRHEQLQAVVSDENGYALGGIAGHAGIWSTAADCARFAAAWMQYRGAARGLFNASTAALFTTVVNATFSARALGWTTMAASQTYRSCGTRMSNATFYHTGYTGTQICGDPASRITTTLLTARVYPAKLANNPGVYAARIAWNDAVVAALGV